MKVKGKWGCSFDGENYSGPFDTRDEAIDDDPTARFVGQFREPISPEMCIDHSNILERVLEHDEYSGEWAEDWGECSALVYADLTARIRKAFREWLDAHNQWPVHGIVDNPETLEMRDEP